MEESKKVKYKTFVQVVLFFIQGLGLWFGLEMKFKFWLYLTSSPSAKEK